MDFLKLDTEVPLASLSCQDGGGPPAEGPPPPPPPWGGGGREGRRGGSPKRLYKAPTDYTKPQKDYKKPRQIIQSLTKTIQRHKILDKDPEMLDNISTY